MSNPTDPTVCARISAALALDDDGPLRLASRDEFGWTYVALVGSTIYRGLWVTAARSAGAKVSA